jgi:hypothetical protein
MTFTTLSPIIAAAGLIAYLVLSLRSRGNGTWLVVAGLAVAFLAFTALTVWHEGPTGFWPVHTANLWGNQVWFDLLLAIGIGWTLILPRARAAGMAPAPWAVLVLATGCIGLLAMLARLLWLERRAA